MKPSPRAHLYRLIVVLILLAVGFAGARTLAIPDSWDSEKFYRVDALEDLKKQPLWIGGNQECAGSGCHGDQQVADHKEHFQALARGKHSGLACENCHGPLSDHARWGKSIAPAVVNREGGLCLGCHAPLLSRPVNFPQFNPEDEGHWYFDVEITSRCQKCHDPHEPNQLAIATEGDMAETEQETEAAP